VRSCHTDDPDCTFGGVSQHLRLCNFPSEGLLELLEELPLRFTFQTLRALVCVSRPPLCRPRHTRNKESQPCLVFDVLGHSYDEAHSDTTMILTFCFRLRHSLQLVVTLSARAALGGLIGCMLSDMVECLQELSPALSANDGGPSKRAI
jgi:hypothetical protein